jgi:hypothetical protein
MKETKKKTGLVVVAAGCSLVFLVILIAAGIYLYAGWQGYQEAPKIVEVQSSHSQLEDPYTLSPDQESKLYEYGYPEAFTILFYDEEAAAGGYAPVRLETWDYYTQGIGLTFINGALTAEDPIDNTGLGALEPLPYYPEQFDAYMNLDEVIAAAGISSYIEIPLEKDFMEGGAMYYANSLTFGLKDDQLRYIEALALTTE